MVWACLWTGNSDRDEEPSDGGKPRKKSWRPFAGAVGQGLQRYDGVKANEKPEEKYSVIYRKGVMYATLKDAGEKVQDERRHEMWQAESESFSEAAGKRRAVDGEVSAGGASREQGEPVSKFCVCVDVPDTPVVRAEEEVGHCARELVRGKGE